jgi:hypothetical protein
VGSTKASGLPTRVIRVSSELPNELYQCLLELPMTINYRGDKMETAKARGELLRTYEKMAKLIQQLEEANLDGFRSQQSRLGN